MDRMITNQKLPFSKKKLPFRVIISYLFDYVIIVALIITFYIMDKVNPFHQRFSLSNYTLQYPYAVHERISVPFLCILVVGVPAGIIICYTLVIDGIFSHQKPAPSSGRRRQLTGRYRWKDRLWELNCGILGLGLSVCAAFTVTGALKNAIGKPRPDVISRCFPDRKDKNGRSMKELVDEQVWGLTDVSLCAQTSNYILQDGFRSFPSGHSSVAFAGLFYLSLYLAAKLHVMDSKGEVWKSFIILCPTLGAALIAGSRIMDARHHPFDVIFGGMLGMLVAWGAYRQYFPPLAETWRKGRAYPIRSWGKGPRMPPPAPVMYEGDAAQGNKAVDEESLNTSGFDAHAGNIFRQQVAANQRHRTVHPHGEAPAPESSEPQPYTGLARDNSFVHALPGGSSNPYGGQRYQRDGYYSSSSDDEAENHELKSTSQTAYNPVSARQVETAYRPPIDEALRSTPSPAPGRQGDMSNVPLQSLATPAAPNRI